MPPKLIPYALPQRDPDWMLARAAELAREMRQRRSCRHFSDRPVPRPLLEELVRTAHSAPSGANRQPWRFVLVDDPPTRREIRIAAEAEERESYARRMPPQWLEALDPIGAGPDKPFLEIAPWLVVVFRVDWEPAGEKRLRSYYPVESVGIACGMFLMACHQVGLATLTHTPSPMRFLRHILRRPENETPFLLIPVGYPADDCTAPDLPRKPLQDILIWHR